MPRFACIAAGSLSVSSVASSFGFSTKRVMRLVSSICMMPRAIASLRPTGMVAMVISAPVTMCWETTD